MSQKRTSIHLPEELKNELVQAAKKAGHKICPGRGSETVVFLREILDMYNRQHKDDPFTVLTPELRSVVIQLGQIDAEKQDLAGEVLRLLLDSWQGKYQ